VKGIDWIKLRAAAARDVSLSHGAFRLLCVLIDHFCVLQITPGEEFSLTYSQVKTWLTLSKNQSRRLIFELRSLGMLQFQRIEDCPPKSVFVFRPIVPKNGYIEVPKNGHNEVPKNGYNHISNPLRGKNRGDKDRNKSSAPEGQRKAPEENRAAAPAEERRGRTRPVSELVAALRSEMDAAQAQEEGRKAALRAGRGKR